MRPMEVQMREYSVMKKLKHPNIVPLLDIEEEVSSKAMVLSTQKLRKIFTLVTLVSIIRPIAVQMREYIAMKKLKHPISEPLLDIEEEVSSKAMVISALKFLKVSTPVRQEIMAIEVQMRKIVS